MFVKTNIEHEWAKEEDLRYKMLKQDQKSVENWTFYRLRLQKLYFTTFPPLTSICKLKKYISITLNLMKQHCRAGKQIFKTLLGLKIDGATLILMGGYGVN